jgi:cyclic pyranopterin phosphate synthase
MLDRFNRNISYLRISVTDRCNLRCSYCMPEEGIALIDKKEILSLEEIVEVVRTGASKFGIRKIRFTGGEPLVRSGIVELVKEVSSIEGIEETAMTTNGILLAEYASALKKAGLKRVNVSLDTLSSVKFSEITRGGKVERVKEGIAAARSAGLTPVKINVVKTEQTDLKELEALEDYCRDNDLRIRYIRQMNLKTGTFSKVEGGSGGNCAICNRLRLMSNGNIKPCLFSNHTFNIREEGIEKAFQLALGHKPKKGEANSNHDFYNIGG